MQPKVLIIDDDKNVADSLKEFLEESDSIAGITISTLRTIDEAELWMKDKNKSRNLKLCILDLMFPPKKGDISGNFEDLTQGLLFYKQYLKGKFKTIILTGALRWTRAEKYVKETIDSEPNTVLTKKPIDYENIEHIILEMLK